MEIVSRNKASQLKHSIDKRREEHHIIGVNHALERKHGIKINEGKQAIGLEGSGIIHNSAEPLLVKPLQEKFLVRPVQQRIVQQ